MSKIIKELERKNNNANKNVEINKRKGISLISLVVIIIIMLIITSVVMLTVLDTSPIEDANEAVIRSDISTMQEEYELAYSDAYAKNLGVKENITNSDLVGVIPNKYKTDFKATTEGIIYIGNNETVEKIAADMGIEKREYNVIEDVVVNTKISSIDVEVVSVAGESIEEYVYQIRQKGTSEWNEFNSVNNTLTIENLLENVEYEVKVLALQGEKTYESEIISVLTQEEIKLGTLTLKLNSASGENYVENTWANAKVYVSVSGENTTYSVSGANSVSETSSATVLTSDGVSIITLKTTKDTASKTQDYTVKIDKGMPEIKELSSNATGVTNSEITITGKAQDSVSGIIAYVFSTDGSLTASSNGWNQIESTTEVITKEYKISENNKYYFYVMDSAKNVTKQEIQIDKIDNTLPTDTAPTLTSTTNSVTAKFKQTDENGIDNSTRAYAIKKTSDSTWGEFVTSDSDSYTFERLDKNISYDVKTYVVDKAGNENTSQVASISTVDITKPEISASEDWVSTSVEVTITYPEITGTTREYSLNGTNWDTVDGLEKKVQVSTNNTKVYARVIDSTNQTSGNVEYEVKCIDSSKPQINSFDKETAPTNTAVTLTGKAQDSESGIVAYMFSTDANLTSDSTGWTEIERTTEEIEYTYSANENTKYYFYVKNDADLVEKAEVIVDNIDKVAPTFDSIEVTSPATGTYKAGQVVEIIATYSENITGTVPVLRIKFGNGTERTISNGTIENNSIKYTYKVQNGDNGVLACTSYYGTLTDVAGNNVTVSRMDFSGNSITADTTEPTLNSINVTSPFTGTYKAGQVVEIVATYSENITGTAPVLKIKFGTGTVRTISSGTIENNSIKYTYTIQDGDNGLLTSTEYTGEVEDSVGNSVTVSNKSLGGNNITADTTIPTDTAPTLTSTTNSIVATFKQTDENGIDNSTRAYAIKKTADSAWGAYVTSDSETYTFERLDKNTLYDVKTKVSDTVGNENESEVATISTVNITNPSISASTDWAASVDVIITYPEIVGTTRQYSLDTVTWYPVSGTTHTETVTVNNTTVYARIIDSTEQVSDTVSYEVTNIDGEAPTLSSIAVTSPEAGDYETGEEITIVATYSENISGTAPVLKVKFGESEERTIIEGTISGNTITYTYTIVEEDVGILTSTDYIGTVVDKANNSLTVANTTITGNEINAVKPVSEVNAEIISNNATTYYGEKVTNYSTGNDTIDSQVEWQIFYADTGNIYLIATDYIHYDLLPTKKVTVDGTETEYELNEGDTDYKAYFTAMLPAYNGSEDITDSRLQALNSSYHEYLATNNTVSQNSNMKAVAYMLDTSEEVWGTFAGEDADYAIGGPTIELLMKSYSQKYSVDYRAQVTSVKGYQISKDGGTNWVNYYSEMLDTSDTQYVISDNSKASGMWLASPSAYDVNSVMYALYYGDVENGSYNWQRHLGFRPIVCLNSNVTLKAVEGGYEIDESFAETVSNNASTYYGQKVTNYSTGNDTIDNQVDWQIFYADTSNIYLIATDYIHADICPPSANNAIYENSDYELSMNNVINDYNGSADITNARLQALNSSYHEYLTTNNTVSKNFNMKAVAYMLDTGIWNTFKGNKAEYAIGGPTVELLMKSYSQKYGVDYRAKATDVKGYQISKDGGVNWADYYSGMLDISDTQYVISTSDKKANGMWLASPSASIIYGVMEVDCDGFVYNNNFNYYQRGFRPLVCLNSDVTLKAVDGGYEIEETFAETVLNNASTYYGQKVTNYSTGNDTIDNQVDWQIFYADTSNIYLIATDYLHYDLLPTKKVTVDGTETVYALNKNSDYQTYFTAMLPAYKGSEDITEEKIQALNSSYHEYLETTTDKKSENPNMKAVAYMLDTDIWNTFKGDKAEYAIGGPTVELLMKSYSQKYGVDYRAQATSINGYQISKDGGTNWAYAYSEMLDTSDTQYVINASDKKAGRMWLASPSADLTSNVMGAYYNGGVYGSDCNYNYLGFRPLVCLNSDVTLKAVTGGYEIE